MELRRPYKKVCFGGWHNDNLIKRSFVLIFRNGFPLSIKANGIIRPKIIMHKSEFVFMIPAHIYLSIWTLNQSQDCYIYWKSAMFAARRIACI